MILGYIIGEPGAGKSTLMAAATAGWERTDFTKPFAYTLLDQHIVQLGKHRDAFSGTDALSMSVQPKVVELLQEWSDNVAAPSLVIGEGDRLANNSFFSAVSEFATVNVVYLHISEVEGDRRRAQRAAQLGTKMQDETWVQGRRTKVNRVRDSWLTTPIGGHWPIEDQVEALYSVSPFNALRRNGDRA